MVTLAQHLLLCTRAVAFSGDPLRHSQIGRSAPVFGFLPVSSYLFRPSAGLVLLSSPSSRQLAHTWAWSRSSLQILKAGIMEQPLLRRARASSICGRKRRATPGFGTACASLHHSGLCLPLAGTSPSGTPSRCCRWWTRRQAVLRREGSWSGSASHTELTSGVGMCTAGARPLQVAPTAVVGVRRPHRASPLPSGRHALGSQHRVALTAALAATAMRQSRPRAPVAASRSPRAVVGAGGR